MQSLEEKQVERDPFDTVETSYEVECRQYESKKREYDERCLQVVQAWDSFRNDVKANATEAFRRAMASDVLLAAVGRSVEEYGRDWAVVREDLVRARVTKKEAEELGKLGRREWKKFVDGEPKEPVRPASADERAFMKAKVMGVEVADDLDARYSTILKYLRDPTRLKVLCGASNLAWNLVNSKIELNRKSVEEDDGMVEDVIGKIRENVETRLAKVSHGDGDEPRLDSVSWDPQNIKTALVQVARESKYNPALDYLVNLKWDRKRRAREFLVTGLGVKNPTPLEIKAVYWFLIQSVTRMVQPGSKADYMLVLVGEQGHQKSTRLARLLPNPDWYTDMKVVPNDRDNLLALHQKLLCEWGELAGMAKREANEVKGFLSRSTDTFRGPYEMAARDHKRRFTFVGTTNDWEFLRGDDSGYRRYWPVRVLSRSGADWVEQNRDQLWAEAYRAFRRGVKPYPTRRDEELLAAAAKRYTAAIVEHGTDQSIVDLAHQVFLDGEGYPLQVRDLLDPQPHFLTLDQVDEVRKRIPSILKSAGWRRVNWRDTDGYAPKDAKPPR